MKVFLLLNTDEEVTAILKSSESQMWENHTSQEHDLEMEDCKHAEHLTLL
jgi:hypothetical protein